MGILTELVSLTFVGVYLGIFLSLLHGTEYFIHNIKCITGTCVLPSYSCTSSGTHIVPKSMVNIEVPVTSKLNTWKWTTPGYVVDLGRLGPSAR